MLKPTGSLFVNLGDKRAGSGGHDNAGLSGSPRPEATDMRAVRAGLGYPVRLQTTRRNAPDRYNQESFGRPKSKMLLPHRYAIGCEDGLADPEGIGWIVRQDQVWLKLNGLPESVTDRTRDQHEYWFHLTKSGRYYSAIDELREQYDPKAHNSPPDSPAWGDASYETWGLTHPLGKLPGSVQAMSSEPLKVPAYLIEWADGYRLCGPPEHMLLARRLYAEGYDPIMASSLDHFAAFPQEWPRRLILGWSPPGICTVCGEGRFPVVEVEQEEIGHTNRRNGDGQRDSAENAGNDRGFNGSGYPVSRSSAVIRGYACSCTPYTDTKRPGKSNGAQNKDPRHEVWDGADTGKREVTVREYHLDRWDAPPTRPAVILDPFGGTGTVCGVANVLGRTGISLDLSWDYSRLGQWRVECSGHFSKSIARTEKARAGVLF